MAGYEELSGGSARVGPYFPLTFSSV
jgi:hypothetical protein